MKQFKICSLLSEERPSFRHIQYILSDTVLQLMVSGEARRLEETRAGLGLSESIRLSHKYFVFNEQMLQRHPSAFMSSSWTFIQAN